MPTDASKLAGGNRHGNHTEQRVTLDLADDYYQIASEATYNYSKEETGKDSDPHKDVKMWHYFVNDIYFAEHGQSELTPYTVTINVKEKADGDFVYSFNAEKESSTRRTLHAGVNTRKGANGELFLDNSIPQNTEKSTDSGEKVAENIEAVDGSRRSALPKTREAKERKLKRAQAHQKQVKEKKKAEKKAAERIAEEMRGENGRGAEDVAPYEGNAERAMPSRGYTDAEANTARGLVKDFDLMPPSVRRSIVELIRSGEKSGASKNFLRHSANLIAYWRRGLWIIADDKTRDDGFYTTFTDGSRLIVVKPNREAKAVSDTLMHELAHDVWARADAATRRVLYELATAGVKQEEIDAIRERYREELTKRGEIPEKAGERSKVATTESESNGRSPHPSPAGATFPAGEGKEMTEAEVEALLDEEVATNLIGEIIGKEEFLGRFDGTETSTLKRILRTLSNMKKRFTGKDKYLFHKADDLFKAFTKVMALEEVQGGQTESWTTRRKLSSKGYFFEDKYFGRQIDKFETLKQGGYITVGDVAEGSPLNKVGIPAGRLYFDVSKIVKEMKERLDVIPADVMKEIPKVLDNPIVITEFVDQYGTHSVNVYGNLYIGGSPVVVGVMIVKGQKGSIVNKVKTVHPNRDAVKEMVDDKILYLSENKREAKLWFQSLGKQTLPLGGNKFGFIRSISQNSEKSTDSSKKVSEKSGTKRSALPKRVQPLSADEMIENAMARGMGVKSQTSAKVERTYSYAELTNKPNMKIVRLKRLGIEKVKEYEENHNLFVSDMMKFAKKGGNAENTDKKTYLYCEDLKSNILIGRESFRHGAARADSEYCRVCCDMANILRNSVAVNELLPREGTNGAIVLLGMAETADKYVYIRTIVENRTWKVEDYDIVYAIRKQSAKKEDVSQKAPGLRHNGGSSSSSTISIAEFLQDVKRLKIANEVFSADVAKKLGVSRSEGTLSGSLRHALPKRVQPLSADEIVRNYEEGQGRNFSYDELIAKDDLTVPIIEKEETVKRTADGSIDLQTLHNKVYSDCQRKETNASNPTYYVEVPDIGRNVEITGKSIDHGIVRKKTKVNKPVGESVLTNARMLLKLPEILKNAIEVNTAAREGNPDVPYTHILLAEVAMEADDGSLEYYVVRFVVHERINQPAILADANILGKLYAAKTKKIGWLVVGALPKSTVARAQTVPIKHSIADFLASVKTIPLSNEIFSEDVAKKLGVSRSEGTLSGSLRHALPKKTAEQVAQENAYKRIAAEKARLERESNETMKRSSQSMARLDKNLDYLKNAVLHRKNTDGGIASSIIFEDPALRAVVKRLASRGTAYGLMHKSTREGMQDLLAWYRPDNEILNGNAIDELLSVGGRDLGSVFGVYNADIRDKIERIANGDGDITAAELADLDIVVNAIARLYLNYGTVKYRGKRVSAEELARRAYQQQMETRRAIVGGREADGKPATILRKIWHVVKEGYVYGVVTPEAVLRDCYMLKGCSCQ